MRYEKNWLKSDIWDKQTWTYRANFTLDKSKLSGHTVQLVFDGIKMGAHVKVGGSSIKVQEKVR